MCGTNNQERYLVSSHNGRDLALAPVKMFPKMLLDDQESVEVDGCREVVKFTKSGPDKSFGQIKVFKLVLVKWQQPVERKRKKV